MKDFPFRVVAALACIFMMMVGFGLLFASAANEYSTQSALGAFSLGLGVIGLGVAWITGPEALGAQVKNESAD